MGGGRRDNGSWDCCPVVVVAVVVVGGVGVYTSVTGACALGRSLGSVAVQERKDGGVGTSFAGAAEFGSANFGGGHFRWPVWFRR